MRHCMYRYRYVSGVPETLERALEEQAAQLEQLLLEPDHAPEASPARISVGASTRTDRLKIPLRWETGAQDAADLSFDGTLELKPLSQRLAGLAIVGAYTIQPSPDQPAGRAARMRRGVEEVADRLLEAVIGRLGGEAGDVTGAPEGVRGPGVLQVGEVMTRSPLVLTDDLPVRTAALLLVHFRVAGAPVVDGEGALVGVLSETDLLAKEAAPRGGLIRGKRAEARRREARTVGDACTRPAKVVNPDTPLAEAARTSLDEDVGRLVVVDDGAVVGILSRHDMLKAVTRSDTELAVGVADFLVAHARVDDVEAHVEWGEVTLTGSTELHSDAADLAARLENIDGVVAVHNHVEWQEDDIGKLPLGYPDSA